MRVRALSLVVALATSFVTLPARADTLVGIAAANELVGVNLELAGEAGSVYAVLGAYKAKTGYEIANMTGFVGLRRFEGGKYNANSYFGGIFLGDVAGGAQYNRMGGGGEVGYQWVTDHLRFNLQMGMAIVGEASGKGAPPKSEVKPQALLGAGVSLRF